MKRFLCGVVLMAVCMFGHATTYYYSTNTAGNAPTMASVAPNSSGQGWCNAWYPIFSSAGHDNSGGYYGTSLTWHVNGSSGYCAGANGWTLTLQTATACPTGKVDQGSGICGAVACNIGQAETFSVQMGTVGNPTQAFPQSDGFCNVTVSKLNRCETDASVPRTASSIVYCTFSGNQTGGQTNGGSGLTNVPASLAPAPLSPTSAGAGGSCPAGSLNIGTDSAGTAMCAGTGTSPLAPTNTTVTSPETTTTNADGSTTSVNKQTMANTDGSTTTFTNTCNKTSAGVTTCNTTQSTGNASDGSVGVSDGKPAAGAGSNTGNGASPSGEPTAADDPSKKDLCALHPLLNVCQNSQVGGNGCSGSVSTVSVTGDAIQGAILKKLADEQCANAVPNASLTLGNNLLAGTDPQQSAINAAMTGTTTDMSGQSLDQSGFLGGGSCLSDRSITLAGHAIPVSFSSVCSNITPIRYIVLACSLIAACMLVSKSVLQG